MTLLWTYDQIRALAPDAATLQKARGVFYAKNWRSTEGNEHLLWGEYAATPTLIYRPAIDLRNARHACTCRAPHKPCKHVLALLLLLQDRNESFRVTYDVPAWVSQGLSATAAQPPPKPAAPPAPVSALDAQDKRRLSMAAGLQDLERRLRDLLSQGLAELDRLPPDFWDSFAARMVDAKLGGVARRLRRCKQLATSQGDWAGKVLRELAALHLLLQAFRQYDTLPLPWQIEVSTQLGVTIKKETVLAGPGLPDDWMVLGQYEVAEESLRARYCWLLGVQTGRYALLLDYAWGGQAFEQVYDTGAQLHGELVYYPGSWPQRALLRSQAPSQAPLKSLPGVPDLESLCQRYAEAIASNPWLPRIPALLSRVTPAGAPGQWVLIDKAGRCVPCSATEEVAWAIAAQSGGHPIPLFGEWDGEAFTPLSLLADGQVVVL